MSVIEIKVPDIGDFDSVEIIDVLVSVGEEISANQDVITLESDKAAMEIPCEVAGKVVELKVSVGDKVSEGDVILMIETAEASLPADTKPEVKPTPEVAAQPKTAPKPAAVPTDADLHAEVLVLGSGPGGYTAAFRAADLGKQVVMVERHERIGGVCLNVGCIPSKALLHTAQVINEAEHMSHHGVTFGKPEIDIRKIDQMWPINSPKNMLH
jgi:dihydrolipoamide dehydrogenase